MNYEMIISCGQGHQFKFGKTDDGFRDCPYCVDSNGIARGLLTLTQAKKEKYGGKKAMSKLGFVIEADTEKVQKKLRAIAKHAEALADELDAIDNEEDTLPTRFEGSD